MAEVTQDCFNSSYKLIGRYLYMHTPQSMDKRIKWILLKFLPLQRVCAAME